MVLVLRFVDARFVVISSPLTASFPSGGCSLERSCDLGWFRPTISLFVSEMFRSFAEGSAVSFCFVGVAIYISFSIVASCSFRVSVRVEVLFCE